MLLILLLVKKIHNVGELVAQWSAEYGKQLPAVGNV